MQAEVLGVLLFSLTLEPSLSEQQLEYAKEQYMAGVTAMEEKEFEAATKHFEEAYRYAPDKHAFNFNIGEAAWAAGDCMKARMHYQRFIQLQPEHAEVETAEARLKKTSDCKTAASDEDTPDFDNDRVDDPKKRALFEAFNTTRRAQALYQAIVASHGKGRPFGWSIWQLRWDLRRIARLILNRGWELPEDELGEIPVAGTRRKACGQARDQEEALKAAYQAVVEAFPDEKDAKVGGRLVKKAERRGARFHDCFTGG